MSDNQNFVKDVFVKYTALAPIMHQQPGDNKIGKGNETHARQLTVMTLNEENNTLTARKLPVVSFNSIRCTARRDFIKEVLYRLDLMDGWKYSPEISGDVLLMLLNGGSTGIGEATETVFIDNYIGLYDELPFFGLFGGCYGKTFFAGRLAGGFVIPAISGMKQLLKKMGSPFADTIHYLSDDTREWSRNTSGFVRFAEKGVKLEQALESFIEALSVEYPDLADAVATDFANAEAEDKEKVTLTETTKAMKDDKDSAKEVLKYFRKDIPSADGEVQKEALKCIGKLTSNQMLYFLKDTIPAGANLHTRICLMPGYGDDALMEATYHAYLEILLNKGYLGGMSSKGYGAVATEAMVASGELFKDVSRAQDFWTWLDDNKDDVRDYLVNFKEKLFPIKKEKAAV